MPFAGRQLGGLCQPSAALNSFEVGERSLRRRRERGFTLIELMVTIFILSILLALAVPSYRTTILNSRRAAASNEFVAALSFARATAVTGRVPVTICKSSSSTAATPVCGTGTGFESGWIVFNDPNNSGTLQDSDATSDVNGDGVTNATDAVLRRHEPLPAGVTLRGQNAIVNRIIFNISGLALNAGQLAVCDSRSWGNDAKVIMLNIGGRVQTLAKTDTQVVITACTPP